MSCKYTQWFIDKRVLVSGRDSILNTQNPLEIGLLPNKGITDDVLVKCSNRDYHTRWDSFSNLISPLLPTLLTGFYTFQNGLTESPAFTIELGGSLLHHTTIDGGDTYSFTFNNLLNFNTIAEGNIVVKSNTSNVEIGSSLGMLTLSAFTQLRFRTPLYGSKPNGSIVQKININGAVEYTPYALPIADGTINQTLITNGGGLVNWTTPTPQVHKCEVLYFTDNPLNTTYNVNGAGNITIDSYILTANTLTSNGSYIELEVGIDISGTVGTNPVMYVNIDSKAITSTHVGAETSYYQVIKTRCTRVSSTTFLTTQSHTVNDSVSGLVLASYSKYDDTNTLVSNFTNQVNIDILFPQNLLSDQIIELKHFTITKYLL